MIIVVCAIFLVLNIIQFSSAYWPPPYQYAVKWFDDMAVDHFSFDNDGRTFSMRYLINDSFFDTRQGAIFFYCGNEGDITLFANNTGFMWDLAPKFKAIVLFAEHRYYGQTMPFGNGSYAPENLGKLSSEQALADFAVFLTWFRKSRPDIRDNTPIVAFGGSYGGMLAAWMRIKYPHIIAGALASSAPVVQFTGYTACETFTSIVSRVFKESGPGCSQCVKKSWSLIRKYAQSDDGRNRLNKIFSFCPDSLVTHASNGSQIIDWITDIWGNLAMINYPYETHFLSPVPAWPIKEACKKMLGCDQDDDSALLAIHDAIAVYLNYTGSACCFSFQEDTSAALGTSGWDYQACTEMVMPMCSTETSMFEKSDWNLSAYSGACFIKYKAKPRPDWAITEYGGAKLQYASNIIFSNGNLDPWSGGGILRNISDTVISILIKDGAHHYDLRGKHPSDTSYVIQARHTEVVYLRDWIKAYRNLYKKQAKSKKKVGELKYPL